MRRDPVEYADRVAARLGWLGERRVGPALAGVLLTGGLALGAGPAAAAPVPPAVPPTPAGEAPRYVALGDSWAAGSAAGDIDPASGPCSRSRVAYPALVARTAGETRWLSRACAAREAGSGNTQFSSLSPDVRAVTATVGADAVGLGNLMRACSHAGTPQDCDAAAVRTEKAVAALPPTLDAAIAELRRGAPRAAVTFLGLPLPAEGAACPAGAADAARARRVDAVVSRLDAVLLERVQAAKMRFVDVRLGFAGHGVCGPQPWLSPWNSADARLAGAPNAAGHADGYRAAAANAVTTALAASVDDPAPPPTSSTTTAADPADSRARPADPAESERSSLFADRTD